RTNRSQHGIQPLPAKGVCFSLAADSNARIFQEAGAVRADSVSNMISRSRRADRIRCKRPDALRPVSERDSLRGAIAVAIRRPSALPLAVWAVSAASKISFAPRALLDAQIVD